MWRNTRRIRIWVTTGGRFISDSDVGVHDGLVGLLYLASAALASQVGFSWIYIGAGVAVLQIASPFTKFCPVYTVLNKVMPDTEPIQNGLVQLSSDVSEVTSS
jgi:hypothetical protein